MLVLYTTAALTAAHLDPGTDLDVLYVSEAPIPKLRCKHLHDPCMYPITFFRR